VGRASVLTCMVNAFPGRVAASLLNVTHSIKDYEALALRLAKKPPFATGWP